MLTILMYSCHIDPDLSNMLNLEMDKLSIWFKASKLFLNLKKTKVMVFRPSQKRMDCDIQISKDNQHIVQVKETIFLGVLLDENLNWKSEVAKSIDIINKCSFYLPKTSLRMLYYSLIYLYFYYCNIVWASTYKTNLRRLVILQKRIMPIQIPFLRNLVYKNLMISICFN